MPNATVDTGDRQEWSVESKGLQVLCSLPLRGYFAFIRRSYLLAPVEPSTRCQAAYGGDIIVEERIVRFIEAS